MFAAYRSALLRPTAKAGFAFFSAAVTGAAVWGGASSAQSACTASVPPLRDFLSQSVRDAKVSAGLAPSPAKYWVVMGNQAADADSIITALTMAYLTKATLADAGTTVLPLVQCAAADYRLRAESVALLRELGITDAMLTFGGNATDDALADSDLNRLNKEKRLQLTLTDHNSMTPRQEQLGLPASVVQIIDHHADDGKSAHVSGPDRVIGYGASAVPPLPPKVALGSACTLVAQAYLQQAPELLRAEPLLGKLLLAGILIDTSNLKDSAKTQMLDMTMVSRLYGVCGEEGKGGTLPPQDAHAAKLLASKFDPAYWSTVPVADLLRADYKQYSEGGVAYGASSVLVPLTGIVQSEGMRGVDDALSAFSATRGLQVSIMMSFSKDGGPERNQPRRQMILYAKNPRLRGAMAYYLEETLKDVLGLVRLNEDAGVGAAAEVLLYEQTELSASRKVLAPALQAFFSLPHEENPYVQKAKL